MRLRQLTGRIATPLVCILAGLLFASGAVAARGGDLRGGERTELADLIREQNREVERLSLQVNELRTEVDQISADEAVGNAGLAEVQERSAEVADSAGLVPMRGPALEVTLDDAPRADDGSLPPDANPDDLVVHQQDVQAVVNAMWAGGAEAMKLMDQRVISTSAVRCVGNTLILQGRVYSPPYVVTAIGDVAGMRSALDASPEVQLYRDYVSSFGLVYEVRELRNPLIPAYEGGLGLRHARVAEPAERR
jgi:uncharacterized protein YlxW (UPF0749 family)